MYQELIAEIEPDTVSKLDKEIVSLRITVETISLKSSDDCPHRVCDIVRHSSIYCPQKLAVLSTKSYIIPQEVSGIVCTGVRHNVEK